MQDAQIAGLAPLLPKALSPQGKLTVNVGLLAGGKLDGGLDVTGAATVPLGSFGVIREIGVKLKFLERTVDIQEITASLGGAPVRAAGRVDLRGHDWLKGAPPPFEIRLRGENVPLARSPDFIVRSDLDVTIHKTNAAPAVLGGVARLRNSVYLRDLKDLLPGGVATPSHRPPYFSVETAPWADWRLDLTLKGDRFLKVNSPLFRGLISGDLKLTGTLKEPVALGDLKIDSGAVQFPFANLDVTRGFVTLTSENPYRPQLQVTAASRRAGYDIKMEVSGPADQAVVQFSSTPPLTADQIVLMLTAGQMPRTDYSLTAEQRAGRVALYLGKNLLSQFGLGDGSDRLTLRSGENITETGKSTYNVEYKLSRHWSLVGEYDQFNAFNLGLKWKILSK